VAQSGMMKEYILDTTTPISSNIFMKHSKNIWEKPMVYGVSGRCNKIALHFAGVPASDGDVLRRAMSGKGRLYCVTKVKDNFFCMLCSKGHPLALSQEIYRQIESFAGTLLQGALGLYAVESYQSLYLKVHYPVEFMVAVINNQGGFYRTEVYVHEAKCPVVLSTPLCQQSECETTVYGVDVYLGFMQLEGLDLKQHIVSLQIVRMENTNRWKISSIAFR
jgi:DNA polymerase-3 subunit alpha/error-prone DNA polymerase